jgi:hypothetical protein
METEIAQESTRFKLDGVKTKQITRKTQRKRPVRIVHTMCLLVKNSNGDIEKIVRNRQTRILSKNENHSIE